MKVLAVETATSWQSVAILDESRVLASHDQAAAGSHAKLLLPTIDRLFRETGLTLKQLDGLVLSIGPGSFTGLRVGLATLLGPILNSRRGELYWALFRWTSDDRLERVVSEQVGTPVMLGSSLTGSAL